MQQLGIAVTIIPADVPEPFDLSRSPAENAEALSRLKAYAVARLIEHGIVLGADTIVSLDGAMLGKPENKQEAIRMLETLSGRTHSVHTGFALVRKPDGLAISGVEETRVTFRLLTHAEIERYVESGSPMDKAGAYGIQDDYGAVVIPRIEGCFYNVVGLPLAAVHAALTTMGALDSHEDGVQ